MMAAVKRKFEGQASGSIAPMTDYRLFNDSVHGHMQFHPLIIQIINTLQVQRLRDLKQLGLAYYLYPSASHNRFEHSLGTCHLAGLMMDTLYKHKPFPKSEAEQLEWEKDKLCVQIAGLCHDLGHGPFSHVWEQFLKRLYEQRKMELDSTEQDTTAEDTIHTKSSVAMFELIFDKRVERGGKKLRNNVLAQVKSENTKEGFFTIQDLFAYYGLGDEEIKLIKDMIRGKKAGDIPIKPKHYLYQIVNNADNGIDVAKMDYLSRDSKMLNINIHFQPYRIIKSCRIVNVHGLQQICFHGKVCTDIADMFTARAVLQDKAYQHPKVKIMTEMVLDAFCYAEEYCRSKGLLLTEIDSLDVMKVTDWIFQLFIHEQAVAGTGVEDFKKGQEIVKRLLQREYYYIIFQKVIENAGIKDIEGRIEAIKTQLLNYVNEKDIGIAYTEIKWSGSNNTNPLENMYVYTFKNPDVAKEYNKEKNTRLSLMPTSDTFRKILVMYKGKDRKMRKYLEKEIKDW